MTSLPSDIMKHLIFSVFTIMLILFSSCQRNEGKDLDDYTNLTSVDSLLFYYTQLRAHEYWEEAEKDTLLRSSEARQDFIEGFEEGFKSIREDAPNYNRGMELGVRMAINILKFENTYGVKLDPDLVVPALKNGLRNGADIPELEYQENFYRILNKLRNEQREHDHQKARTSLIEEARHQKMSKITDDLYFRIIKKGEGEYAQYGNTVFVTVNYERADGQDIVIPSPGMVTIGSDGMPNVLCKAYTRLNKGEIAMFATTADAVFGSRTYVMGMKPEDVLLLTITLNDIYSPHELSDSITM